MSAWDKLPGGCHLCEFNAQIWFIYWSCFLTEIVKFQAVFCCSWSAMLQDICIHSQLDALTGTSKKCCKTQRKMQLFPTVRETLGFAFCEYLGLTDYLDSKERWKEESLLEKDSINSSKHFTLFIPVLIIIDSEGYILLISILKRFNLFSTHGHKDLIMRYLGRDKRKTKYIQML